MRGPATLFALLSLLAFGGVAASAQTPLSCSVAPQTICEDPELLALENERAGLVAQLPSADAQHPALANEQVWSDNLGACGEDAACYRSAYLNHNRALREAVVALPGATSPEAPPEEPPDALSVEEETMALDALQEERLREPRAGRQVYAEEGAVGWGFFTAIGVTLLIFWLLMRALAKNRRELRADEARLRGQWS